MDGSSRQGTLAASISYPCAGLQAFIYRHSSTVFTYTFTQVKREQVVTTIGELIEAKTEVANIVVDVLSS